MTIYPIQNILLHGNTLAVSYIKQYWGLQIGAIFMFNAPSNELMHLSKNKSPFKFLLRGENIIMHIAFIFHI